MTFNEIDNFTYIGNKVSIGGDTREVDTSLDNNIEAVQFHKGRDYLLEEPSMTKVSFSKYQNILDEWVANAPIYPEETQEERDIEEKKRLLGTLTVTTSNGNEFDGNDIARVDMVSAIQASEVLNLTEHKWKLADNSWKVISIDELKEALSLAIVSKGNILEHY